MITTQDLAGILATAAGEEWPSEGLNARDRTYQWLHTAEAAMPAVSAALNAAAARLDRLATIHRTDAGRYPVDTPERARKINEAGAYIWAAHVVRGETA